MKFFAVICLAVAVSAEADPYYLGGYGAGYAGLGYGGYGYSGLGYAGLGYAGLGYAAAGQVSASLSGSTSVNIAGLAPAAVPAAGYGYAGAGRYVANSGGVVHVAKREAEADAYYLGGYAGLGYAGLGYAGLGYAGLGHAGLGYAHTYAAAPVVAAASQVSVSPSASVNIAGLAPAALPAIGGLYAGAGRYVANSAGTVHVAKREAEADAYYLGGYGAGLGYAGLGYAGLGYAGLGYAGLGHAGLGYAHTYAAAPVVAAASQVSVSPSASVNIAGLAPAALPAIGGLYAGAGRYVANSAGTVHVA